MKLKCLLGNHKFDFRLATANFQCVEGDYGGETRGVIVFYECTRCGKYKESAHFGDIEVKAIKEENDEVPTA